MAETSQPKRVIYKERWTDLSELDGAPLLKAMFDRNQLGWMTIPLCPYS